MRFQRFSPKGVRFDVLMTWSLLNIFLIFILIIGFRTFFSTPDAGLDLRLPRTAASVPADGASFVVLIDAKDGLYWQGRSVSFDGFQEELSRSASPTTPVLIKADRRASVGILSQVWDACRSRGVARVMMATNG